MTAPILLSPGPVSVSDRVRAAAARRDWCHREADYAEIQTDARRRLTGLFAPSGRHAVALLGGSGTAAVEAAIATLVPPGGALGVLSNGVYGERMAEIARLHGLRVLEAPVAWDVDPDPAEIARACAGASLLGVVLHETSTGRRNPVEEIARASRIPLLVDAVSGLGGEAFDAEGAGACVATANKCLQGLPGVSFALVREDLLAASRRWAPRSYVLDLRRYARGEIPFTPPVHAMAAFREALRELSEETVPGRIERYRRAAARLRDGFARMGLGFLLPPPARSNTVTALRLPPGVAYGALHDAVRRAGFVIYAGQGGLEGRAFRVANMGWIPDTALDRFQGALGDFLGAACAR